RRPSSRLSCKAADRRNNGRYELARFPRPASGERVRVRGLVLAAFLLAGFASGAAVAAAAADDPALDALVRAYPEELAGYDAAYLIWRDGTRMPYSGGRLDKTFEEMLRHGSILDQVRLPYPTGVAATALVPQTD